MLDNFVIARLPLSKEIVIGKLNKKRNMFLDKKIVTGQAMAVVVEHVLEGLTLEENTLELTFDNNEQFEITVTRISKDESNEV